MTREEYLKYGVETGLLKFWEYLKLTRPLKLLEGLEEAAEKASKTWRRNEDGSEERELFPQTFIRGFIAGAEWMAGQGETVEGEIVKDISNRLAVTAKGLNGSGFNFGDKVIVQIRKI